MNRNWLDPGYNAQVTANPNYEDLPALTPAWGFEGPRFTAVTDKVGWQGRGQRLGGAGAGGLPACWELACQVHV